MNTLRVKPLKANELSLEQLEFIKIYADPKRDLPNIFGTLLHHLKLLKAWSRYGMHTMQGSLVDPVLREVAILRTALNTNCNYEFVHHCEIGEKLGMTQADFDNIKSGDPLRTEEMNLMVTCADELKKHAKLSDETWYIMMDKFGLKYTLDVIFTVGAYATMGSALNSCGVQLEDAYL